MYKLFSSHGDQILQANWFTFSHKSFLFFKAKNACLKYYLGLDYTFIVTVFYPYSWVPPNNFISTYFSSAPSNDLSSMFSKNLFLLLIFTKYKSFTKRYTYS